MEVVDKKLAHGLYFKCISKWKAEDMPTKPKLWEWRNQKDELQSRIVQERIKINNVINLRLEFLMSLSKEVWK